VVDHVPDLETVRVLTIVDAPRWPMLLEVVEPLIVSQLVTAHVVAVNKVDEVGDEALAATLEAVRGLAPKATVLPVSATTGAGMQALLTHVP
jgi:G3E family GTPase